MTSSFSKSHVSSFSFPQLHVSCLDKFGRERFECCKKQLYDEYSQRQYECNSFRALCSQSADNKHLPDLGVTTPLQGNFARPKSWFNQNAWSLQAHCCKVISPSRLSSIYCTHHRDLSYTWTTALKKVSHLNSQGMKQQTAWKVCLPSQWGMSLLLHIEKLFSEIRMLIMRHHVPMKRCCSRRHPCELGSCKSY